MSDYLSKKRTSLSFPKFCETVTVNQWSDDEIRCAAPPSVEILELIDMLGIDRYQRYVDRYLDAKATAE